MFYLKIITVYDTSLFFLSFTPGVPHLFCLSEHFVAVIICKYCRKYTFLIIYCNEFLIRYQQPARRMGGRGGRMQRTPRVPLREVVREDRLDAAESTAASDRRPQHRRLHDREEQRGYQLQGKERSDLIGRLFDSNYCCIYNSQNETLLLLISEKGQGQEKIISFL